jgi:hypothetical protein
MTIFDVFTNVDSSAHLMKWIHSITHKEKHNVLLYKIPIILIDSDKSFNTEVKDWWNKNVIFYTLLNLCPCNASYSKEECSKFVFSPSPSRIDFIRRADRTCQVKHSVIKKSHTNKTLLTERPLRQGRNWTQKLTRPIRAPNGEGREDNLTPKKISNAQGC